MPERIAYDEAMNLSRVRLKVQDQDLKQGKVDFMTIQTDRVQIQRPWGIQGGFAVVYKFFCQSGKKRALRCFLIPMAPDIADRYQRIGAYFAAHAPAITVEFKYHDGGILIKEYVYGQLQNKTYPLIEMEWVDGMTLLEYLDRLCQKRDIAMLANVVDQWISLVETLQKARISHGDLGGTDVMVRTNGQLVLVDYDGVYIPDFAGQDPIILGKVDYQHPQIGQRPFNERTDDFSAWVIYIALLAVQLRPELWNKYMLHNTQGKLLDNNLLFKSKDFMEPDRSALFAELSQVNDPRMRKALHILKQACTGPVTQVPPFDMAALDPAADKKQTLAELELAIQNNDDEAIVQAWTPLLENYPPAQQYRSRLKQAEQVAQKLRDLREALKRGSLQQISVYDPILDQSSSFTSQERERLRLARQLQEAFNNDDDSTIVTTWDEIRLRNYVSFFRLTWQQEQRRNLAQRRTTALVKIFFCYAHEDKALLDRLKRHLKPLQREGLIEVWHDQDISAGTEWEQEIKEHLNKADIILLLVSPDFMYSDYCYSIEMNRAIERHEAGEARVIPVILRPTSWQGILGKLQALPTDAQPVTSSKWPSLDEAFFDVTEGIRTIVEKIVSK